MEQVKKGPFPTWARGAGVTSSLPGVYACLHLILSRPPSVLNIITCVTIEVHNNFRNEAASSECIRYPYLGDLCLLITA